MAIKFFDNFGTKIKANDVGAFLQSIKEAYEKLDPEYDIKFGYMDKDAGYDFHSFYRQNPFFENNLDFEEFSWVNVSSLMSNKELDARLSDKQNEYQAYNNMPEVSGKSVSPFDAYNLGAIAFHEVRHQNQFKFPERLNMSDNELTLLQTEIFVTDFNNCFYKQNYFKLQMELDAYRTGFSMAIDAFNKTFPNVDLDKSCKQFMKDMDKNMRDENPLIRDAYSYLPIAHNENREIRTMNDFCDLVDKAYYTKPFEPRCLRFAREDSPKWNYNQPLPSCLVKDYSIDKDPIGWFAARPDNKDHWNPNATPYIEKNLSFELFDKLMLLDGPECNRILAFATLEVAPQISLNEKRSVSSAIERMDKIKDFNEFLRPQKELTVSLISLGLNPERYDIGKDRLVNPEWGISEKEYNQLVTKGLERLVSRNITRNLNFEPNVDFFKSPSINAREIMKELEQSPLREAKEFDKVNNVLDMRLSSQTEKMREQMTEFKVQRDVGIEPTMSRFK